MTLTHVVYIPITFLVGLVVGWIVGSRAARAEIARQESRLKR